MTELVADSLTSVGVTVREMVEGQTAARLVITADDYGWWSELLADRTVHPVSGIEKIVAGGLVRCGLLTPLPGEDESVLVLTDAGREVAHARGFVRVVARGWEPTFDKLPACRQDPFIPARTAPGEVALAAAEIVERRPDILTGIGTTIATDTPGTTVDLGCADANRIIGLSGITHAETFLGVDIEQEVVDAAAATVERQGLTDGSACWPDRSTRAAPTSAGSTRSTDPRSPPRCPSCSSTSSRATAAASSRC